MRRSRKPARKSTRKPAGMTPDHPDYEEALNLLLDQGLSEGLAENMIRRCENLEEVQFESDDFAHILDTIEKTGVWDEYIEGTREMRLRAWKERRGNPSAESFYIQFRNEEDVLPFLKALKAANIDAYYMEDTPPIVELAMIDEFVENLMQLYPCKII